MAQIVLGLGTSRSPQLSTPVALCPITENVTSAILIYGDPMDVFVAMKNWSLPLAQHAKMS